MIKREDRNGVLLLQLDRGATNPLSPELVEELAAALDEASNGARALVLAGAAGKFLSIGFDIPVLLPLDREAMRGFETA